MARGKHGSQAARRRTHAAQARLEQLRAELADEKEALADAAAEDARLQALADELGSAISDRNAAVSAEQTRLTQEADLLYELVREVSEQHEALDDRWHTYSTRLVQSNGGGVAGIESLMQILSPTSKKQGISFDVHHQGLANEEVFRLQVVRGSRTSMPDFPDQPFTWGVLEAPYPRQILDDVDAAHPDGLPSLDSPAAKDAETRARKLRKSTADALDSDAVTAHHAPWWFDPCQLEGTRAKQLGALTPTDVTTAPQDRTQGSPIATPWEGPWPAPTGALPALRRKRLANDGRGRDLLTAWHTHMTKRAALAQASLSSGYLPVAPAPLYPQPGHATAIQHAYTLAAASTWNRALPVRRADPAGDDSVQTGPCAIGELAVALAAGSTFWLPEGQTRAFADSEPLDAESLDELRLPYPATFLAVAEPIVLEPVTPMSDVPETTRRRLSGIMAASLKRAHLANTKLDDLESDLPGGAVSSPIPLGEALDICGGRIEGALLLGDSLGRVEDTFAWCVAIHSPRGSGLLGRYVIPASLANCQARDVLLNLAAVISWADWHSPDAVSTQTIADVLAAGAELTSKHLDEAHMWGAGVHVLNVRSTSSTRQHTAASAPTKTMAPHLRRGHWRRQRHGTARSQVKMIRIAPVAVNAHLGAARASVYTLRAPVTG